MKFEYKSILVTADVKGFWRSSVTEVSCAEMEAGFNELGAEGWEMIGVFPVTNGGSPAQIYQAIHHFKREVLKPAK